MIESVFKLLEAGLTLWNTKESKQYLKEVINLKKEFYEEFNKDERNRSNAVLDNIKHQLRIIEEGFTSQVGITHTRDK
ncbi:MAG: hypothetical protein Unbinned5081contig1003_14 [Prokaryotic dsDNA virus sp.]|nr:MAG: hypothetical protein Unbinned5081contig1003_14 [Prokaryotic dsDNA virus sp.]